MEIFKVAFFVIISGYEIKSEVIKLKCNDIRQLVDGHNARRLMLAKGAVMGQPAARDMKMIVWDNELADKAAGWAALEKYLTHNPDMAVRSNRFMVGENSYYYMTANRNVIINMELPLTTWWNEHTHFRYGPVQKNRDNGHYTQMAWSNTTQLGCALDKSKKDEFYVHYIVCNYGPLGNILGDVPYLKGKAHRHTVLKCDAKSNCSQNYGPDCS